MQYRVRSEALCSVLMLKCLIWRDGLDKVAAQEPHITSEMTATCS